MKTIQLTQGKFAQVDDEDYDFLIQFKWWAIRRKNTYYAVTRKSGDTNQTRMHRLILELTDSSILADHADLDGLNNQRYNLRICNSSENQKNKRGRGKSKFLGVTFKANKTTYTTKNGEVKNYENPCWEARIKVDKKYKILGLFPYTPNGEIDAAKAYDKAAKKYHGEFANPNFKSIKKDFNNYC